MMEDMRLKLAIEVDAEVVAGLRAILETEVKDCKQQKAVYDGSRVDLSNAQTKLAAAQKGKQQPKIDAAQADLDATKKKYEQCEKETLVRLRDGCTVLEYSVLELLLKYVDTQKAFYNRGFQMLNASMVDMAEYRRHSDENRRKLAARPQNPKRVTMRMSFSPKVNKKRFFGASLGELEADGHCVDGVPIFLLTILLYIEHWGLEEEGIFRIAGNHNVSEAIRAQVEQSGGEYDWGTNGEKLLNATDLFKQFLRELPVSLLPPDFTSAAFSMKPSTNPSQNIAFLQNLLVKQPIGSQRILKLVFELLNKYVLLRLHFCNSSCWKNFIGPNCTGTPTSKISK